MTEEISPKTKRCLDCSVFIPLDSLFCPKCGEAQPANAIPAKPKNAPKITVPPTEIGGKKRCPNCNVFVELDAEKCPKCGETLRDNSEIKKEWPKNEVAGKRRCFNCHTLISISEESCPNCHEVQPPYFPLTK